MTYEKIKESCCVGSGIYRISKPNTIYWKKPDGCVEPDVPSDDKKYDDWVEYNSVIDPNC